MSFFYETHFEQIEPPKHFEPFLMGKYLIHYN